MTITINGTTGIAGVDGSAATPSVQGGDTNTGIFFPAADTIAFAEGGTEVMRIDSSGNVGIGTTTPNANLEVNGGAASSTIKINNSSYPTTGLDITKFAVNADVIINLIDSGNLRLYTANTERMRIDSSGNVGIGTTSPLFVNSHAFVNSGQAILGLRNSGATAGLYWQVGPDGNSSFKVYNQASVGVFISTGNTAWTSSSDETLKNITGTIQNGLQKVASLRAAEFSWKTDDTSKSQVGLIAQDVQKVLPEAVDVSSDGTLGVRYTEVIPLLVAAIQEQQAMITALTDRITALEVTT